jgi:type VII secretion-associated serine protease mycosin
MVRAAALLCALLAGLALPAGAGPAHAGAAPSTCRPEGNPVADQRSWAQQRLGYERVWPLSTGAGVTVAVVDTGVNAHHPQLSGHVLPGYDVVSHGSTTVDCQGHGTFVAGIIAAHAVAGSSFLGVAPGAAILPVRETLSNGTAPVAQLADGIRHAVDLGAKVINISVVTETDVTDLRDAVAYALARGATVVAAAGNDAGTGNPVEYPAAYPGVLAVGAINADGTRSAFSETGAVGVVAPGAALVSTAASGAGLVFGGGTSFAAPFVSGVAALVLAYHPGLTPAQVIHRIEATADHPPGALPDPQYGWGVVNPYAAVTALLPEEGRAPVATPRASAIVVAAAHAPAADDRRGLALGLAVIALAVAAAALAGRSIVAAGRARGWRPGKAR